MRCLKAVFLLLALLSPARAEDGPAVAARARVAAAELAHYIDGVAKAGGRPDFSLPSAKAQLDAVFDLDGLASLPPPAAGDVGWLLDWGDAANQVNKRIIPFGLSGPNPDPAALQRNFADYQDQAAAALNFILRFQARQSVSLMLFMDQLPAAQRTPVREAGLKGARGGAAELLSEAVCSVAQGMKPANARLLAAALRDTRQAWPGFVLPDDRARLLGLLQRMSGMVTDAEVRSSLAAFTASLAEAK